ncbi:hypothetical protein LJC12_00065 [Odoribacter sp. OttesenSCG-928-J03]|nr:hypothetical protein [Odoribacter sp. OttesenSCG-928-J03]MDL2330464.1 hypothetical protein [Odoribacter sp. OttesenSCG-928-A06]
MKNRKINIMRNTKRLKLTILQTFTHYGIVLLLLFIVSLTVWNLVEIYFIDTYKGVRAPADELINFSLPFLGFAIIFAIIQYRRLNFREFQVSYTDEQFQEAIKRTVDELEWKIESNNKTFFRAFRPWNWTGSWGEMVTIIKGKDRLLINSICDPNHRSSVASYGWNKRNIKTFLKNLSDVLENKPQEIIIEKVENEWTAKRILIRLFTYPFYIFLIVFGVYMLIKPLTINAIFAGLGGIIIASIYLYSDIKILTTKYDKEKSPNC